MDDFTPDILTLMDEDGNEHVFEILDEAEIDGESYQAVTPVPEDSEDVLESDGALIILRNAQDDEGDYLEIISDDKEYDKLADFFMERLEDLFEFEDTDGEEDTDDE